MDFNVNGAAVHCMDFVKVIILNTLCKIKQDEGILGSNPLTIEKIERAYRPQTDLRQPER